MKAQAEYSEVRTVYLEKKAAFVAAIERENAVDDELEAMTAEYEPPAKPEAV